MQTQLASVANIAEYNAKLHDANEFKATDDGKSPKPVSHYASGTSADHYDIGRELVRC